MGRNPREPVTPADAAEVLGAAQVLFVVPLGVVDAADVACWCPCPVWAVVIIPPSDKDMGRVPPGGMRVNVQREPSARWRVARIFGYLPYPTTGCSRGVPGPDAGISK